MSKFKCQIKDKDSTTDIAYYWSWDPDGEALSGEWCLTFDIEILEFGIIGGIQ